MIVSGGWLAGVLLAGFSFAFGWFLVLPAMSFGLFLRVMFAYLGLGPDLGNFSGFKKISKFQLNINFFEKLAFSKF